MMTYEQVQQQIHDIEKRLRKLERSLNASGLIEAAEMAKAYAKQCADNDALVTAIGISDFAHMLCARAAERSGKK